MGLGAGSLHRIGDIERRSLLLALRVFGIRCYRALPCVVALLGSVVVFFVFRDGTANTNRHRPGGVGCNLGTVLGTLTYLSCRSPCR